MTAIKGWRMLPRVGVFVSEHPCIELSTVVRHEILLNSLGTRYDFLYSKFSIKVETLFRKG